MDSEQLWVQPVYSVINCMSLFVHDSISQDAAFEQPACVGVTDPWHMFYPFSIVQSPHLFRSNATAFMETMRRTVGFSSICLKHSIKKPSK